MNHATPNIVAVRRANAAHQRGVAMLLVIIALGAATILTTAFISTRSDTADISENMAEASQSYWSAKSAMDVTEAILQSDIDWISVAGDGTLTNTTIAGADVQIKMTNLVGDAPTDSDKELIVTTVASYNGVESTFQALVTRQPVIDNIEDAIDPELGEFAIYAKTGLTINGTLAIWRASPEADGGGSANIGVGFSKAGNMKISGFAKLSRVKLFILDIASAGLQGLLESTQFIGGAMISSDLPVVDAAEPSWTSSTTTITTSDTTRSAVTASLAPGKYRNVTIDNGSVITIGTAGAATKYIFNDLTVTGGSVLVLKGDVSIHLNDNLIVNDLSAVELDGNATVVFTVASDVYVDNAVVGFSRTVGQNASRSSSAGDAYINPSRIRFLLTNPDGFDPDPEFMISTRALVIGAVHATRAEVLLRSNSILYGRATGASVTIDGTASLLYDPCLNNGVGFTTLDGPLYDENGNLIADAVEAVTDTVSTVVTGVGSVLGKILGGGGGGGGADETEAVEEDDADQVASRDARRVKVRVWPMKAHSIEHARADADSTEPDGSFLIVKAGANEETPE